MKIFREEAKTSTRNENLKFWQTGNHAIELYSEKFTWDKINYIHNNPVEEQFVKKPEDWLYSSASNYVMGEGLLKEVCFTRQMGKFVGVVKT